MVSRLAPTPHASLTQPTPEGLSRLPQWKTPLYYDEAYVAFQLLNADCHQCVLGRHLLVLEGENTVPGNNMNMRPAAFLHPHTYLLEELYSERVVSAHKYGEKAHHP